MCRPCSKWRLEVSKKRSMCVGGENKTAPNQISPQVCSPSKHVQLLYCLVRQESTTRSPQPGVHSQESSFRSPQPGIHSQESTTRTPQPGIHSQESTARNPQQGIHFQVSRAKGQQPGIAGSPQPGILSQGPPARIPQPGIRSQEPSYRTCYALAFMWRERLSNIIRFYLTPSSLKQNDI